MAKLSDINCEFLTLEILNKLDAIAVKTISDFFSCSPLTLKQSAGLDCEQQVKLRSYLIQKSFEKLDIIEEANLDTDLFGSILGGHIYEVYGRPGAGKTQLCHYLATKFANESGKVLYMDTKNDFSLTRLKDFGACNVESVLLCKAFDLHQAIKVTDEVLKTKPNFKVNLFILDNITSLVMPLLEDEAISDTFALIGDLIGRLRKMSRLLNCPIFIVNNGTTKPALGKLFQSAADIQFFIKQDGDKKFLCVQKSPYETFSPLSFKISKTSISVEQ